MENTVNIVYFDSNSYLLK